MEEWEFDDDVMERLTASDGLTVEAPTFQPELAKAVVTALRAEYDIDVVVGCLSLGALPTLLETATAEPDEEARDLLDEVIEQLLSSQTDESYAAVRQWAAADDPRVRAAGHLGLGRFRAAGGDSWLVDRWRDEDEALVEHGLADPDPAVQAAARTSYLPDDE
ncbi:HEAT repeat domain-containing protein [Dactylosporangium sp. NPDC050588]|uniref:HEAT repeat domain-containing protein n=1 Tax=Dactylosporangium sp. NPDC050588 TaxID=3157211 RepID=UPI0033DD1239